MIANQEALHDLNPDQPFLSAVLALFNGEKSGNLYSYMYGEGSPDDAATSGGEYWHDFLTETHDYYLVREEAAAIQKALEPLSMAIPEGLLSVELGPGDSTATDLKTLPFNKAIKPAAYLAIDINATYAHDAAATVAKAMTIPAHGQMADFIDGGLITQDAPAVYSLFGGLLANIPTINGVHHLDTLARHLHRIRNMMKPGDYLVITQDSCRDPRKLHAAYNDPLLARCAMSILHRIVRELPTHNFNPDNFEYAGIYTPATENQGLCIRAKKLHTFRIGNHSFVVPAGQILTLINSYKFNPIDYRHAAQAAGFKPASAMINHADTNLHILRAG